MRKAIVSGANGFIGSNVIRYLVEQGVGVIALCRMGHCANVLRSPLVKIISMELERINEVGENIPEDEYDVFYHFAWSGVSGNDRTNIKLQLQNVQWTIDALKLAHAIGVKRFVGIGSIMEHETMAATYTQGNKPGMGFVYGGAKYSAHVMCMSVAAKLGIELLWAEVTNIYGVGDTSTRMINTALRTCLQGKEPCFTKGEQNYDFVYVDDVVRAFYLIAQYGQPFYHYMIGSSDAKPLREFLLEMQAVVAADLNFRFGEVPFTGVNLPLSVFDCSQTTKDTGFRAKISFKEGIQRTYDWLKEREGVV